MPGVSVYEKLTAVSNKQSSVSTRQQLIEAITGLSGITVDSDWQDVPMIYSNANYNNILRPVTINLMSRNRIITPDDAVLSVDRAITSLSNARNGKSGNVVALQQILTTLSDFKAGNATLQEADSSITSIMNTYVDDKTLTISYYNDSLKVEIFSSTFTPVKSTFDFTLSEGPLGDTSDALPTNFSNAGVTSDITFPLASDGIPLTLYQDKFDSFLQAVESQISDIQAKTEGLNTLTVALNTLFKTEQQSFESLKKSVTDQLTGKLAAVSQAIEFYDAVIST